MAQQHCTDTTKKAFYSFLTGLVTTTTTALVSYVKNAC